MHCTVQKPLRVTHSSSSHGVTAVGARGGDRSRVRTTQESVQIKSKQLQHNSSQSYSERIYNLQHGKLTSTVASSKCFVPDFKSPLKHYVMVGSWFLEGASVAEVFECFSVRLTTLILSAATSVSFANKYFIFYWIFYEAMKTNKKATALLCIVNKLTWLG